MNQHTLSTTSLLWVLKDEPANPDEFGQALSGFTHALCRLARKLLPLNLQSKADPEDLVQEAILDAFSDFKQFIGTTLRDLRVWVCGILRHKVANFVKRFRRKKRQAAQERSLEDIQLAGTPMPASGESELAIVLRYTEEVSNPLTFAFLSLGLLVGGEVAWVFFQHYEDERSFEEIASIRGISRSTAYRLWLDALAVLKSFLHDCSRCPA